MSDVVIVNSSYKDISTGVDKIFDKFQINLRGKKVFVKPNILGPYKPDKGVTTHPALVREVVNKLKSQGAVVSVGDNSGVQAYGKTANSAKVSGIIDASLGSFLSIGDSPTLVRLNHQINVDTYFSREVFECDYFISLPKFKTHLNTTITCAIKNSYGLIVGSQKLNFHKQFQKYTDFSKLVVEVYKERPPDLIIADAIVGMEGDGPNSPHLRDIGKLIASKDGVALDAVVAHMMGIEPETVDILNYADSINLGKIDISKMNISGELTAIDNFKLPGTYYRKNAKQSLLNNVLAYLVDREKLVVQNKKCTNCQLCYKSCPVDAIDIAKNLNYGKPYIHTDKCILCFCCKEVCQYDSIKLKGVLGFLQRSGIG